MENSQIKNSAEIDYDRPRRPRGRPIVGSMYTEEEKIERRRKSNLKCYYNNHEYYKLYNRLNKQEIANKQKDLK